jgi:acyl carrier protein
MYGITETTVHVTYRKITIEDIQKGRGSVIGIPIPDLKIYLLDQNLQLVPVEIPGELYVGGAGLARGYLNRPELTRERFIMSPFSPIPGERLYKSGDLARYHPDLDLEYMGRIDNQVQIRGFRVELGEIEAVLGKHEAVREVSAMVWKDAAGNDRLVAYIVPYEKQHPSARVFRNYLMKKLPEYMIPNAFVFLEKFPLTPNGKLDRRALPSPVGIRPELEANYVAPRTEMERTIASIWREVLHLEKVGIHDNFFEVGGHSLLATQVVSRINKSLEINLPLQVFFKNPTITGLSGIIEKLKKEGAIFQIPGIKPISRESRRMKVST